MRSYFTAKFTNICHSHQPWHKKADIQVGLHSFKKKRKRRKVFFPGMLPKWWSEEGRRSQSSHPRDGSRTASSPLNLYAAPLETRILQNVTWAFLSL